VRRSATPVALGLLGLALVLLALGDFIQVDDVSGLGSEEWNLPLGYLAALAAVAAVVVSLFDRRARQALGGALLLLDAVVFVWSSVDDGFRFVWTDNEGELLLLQLALGLVGLALMTPSLRTPLDDPGSADPGRGISGWARAVGYLTALVVVTGLALYLGILHFEHTECAGTHGDCELGGLEGLVWATLAFVAMLVVIAVTEVVVRVRRARAHNRGERSSTPA
jgi:hypothetical protein